MIEPQIVATWVLIKEMQASNRTINREEIVSRPALSQDTQELSVEPKTEA